MGNTESGTAEPEPPAISESASLGSGRPRSPAPSLPTINEEDQNDAAARASWEADQENNGDYPNARFEIHDDKEVASSPSIGFEVEHSEDYEDEDDAEDGEEKPFQSVEEVILSDDGIMSIMEASAAVFHYLAEDEGSVVSEGVPEHISISQRSAAVFRLLEEEARKGNHEPIIQFLETATAVSALLVDDNSVSGASAAVFRFLEEAKSQTMDNQSVQQPVQETTQEKSVQQSTRGLDQQSTTEQPAQQSVQQQRQVQQQQAQAGDERSVFSQRSAAVFKVLDDARSVDPSVSDKSAMVFRFLDDAKSVDAKSISEFSSAVFKMLDEAKSHDARSVSDRSAAVFGMLDDASSVRHEHQQRQLQHFQSRNGQNAPMSPMSNASTLGHSNKAPSTSVKKQQQQLSQEQQAFNPHLPQIVEEHKQDAPGVRAAPAAAAVANDTSATAANKSGAASVAAHSTNSAQKSKYSETANTQREDYPEVGMRFSEDGQSQTTESDSRVRQKLLLVQRQQQRQAQAQPQQQSRQLDDLQDDANASDGDIDLIFVEHFDRAFNEFIGKNPKFLMKNPDLVHHIRIAKLQKMLEFLDLHEHHIQTKMTRVKNEKEDMERAYHLKLRDASRRKAARQINLQSDLQKLSWSTKVVEARLMWKFVDSCEARSKRQYQLRQKYKKLSFGETREDLLNRAPEGPDGQELVQAITAKPPPATAAVPAPNDDEKKVAAEKQEKEQQDLRQYQVDIAFLNAEVTVLKKKLAYHQMEAKKKALVEKILLQLDAPSMSKLKAKYLKKMGLENI